MIDRQAIGSILEQYEKHGWKLRRVLLSSALRASEPDLTRTLFENAEIRDADLDAVWFSRSSRPGLTAWELRHLSTTPYALVETVRDGISDDELEETLGRTEVRLSEAVSKRKENGAGAA